MFNRQKFIVDLLKFSSRQLENENKAGKFLTRLLEQNQVGFTVQKFTLKLPQFIQAELTADGQKIACAAICFASGKISGKDNILSSLSKVNKDLPHIGFNPFCDGISAANRAIHYPALTVSRNDLPKILKAKRVKGVVEVKPVKHVSQNILVGNLINPKNLIFTHYDSIETGAIDNASGVTVTMQLILSLPKLLEKNLFVLSGNEELSYDFPIYWGHGYRMFEKKYSKIMNQAKKILVVDCVGNASPKAYTDPYWINEGFPVINVNKFLAKTALIAGDFDKLMAVYHSRLDDISKIKKSYLDQAYKYLLKLLK